MNQWGYLDSSTGKIVEHEIQNPAFDAGRLHPQSFNFRFCVRLTPVAATKASLPSNDEPCLQTWLRVNSPFDTLHRRAASPFSAAAPDPGEIACRESAFY